ncbi:hypothetical protein [Pseudanabaena sp. PCC 6802]|uniref:hypothetical protein n=1 Tax=Pseudanabaena sp. PCC 6802 TaxID=118173 RepID=UPI00034B7B8A|nr:hypothetical protein [Pseudanabaena sp. PCC 6802]
MRIIKGARIGSIGKFESIRDVPLASKVFSLRLPVDIDEYVRAKGHEWVREVLRKAIAEDDKDSCD